MIWVIFHSILVNASNEVANMLYEVSERWFYELGCTKEFDLVLLGYDGVNITAIKNH